MIRRPPRSTLFPTRRSSDLPITDPESASIPDSALTRFFKSLVRDKRDVVFIYVTLRITFILVPLALLVYMPFIHGWLWWVIAASDRKSTRLNSSHLVISYAV